MKILIIGRTDVGRRTCALLNDRGVQVLHLESPTDAEVVSKLNEDVQAVAVLMHDDIRALRYSLLIEHERPGIRLFATIFDRTVRSQLESHIPNCIIMSPAAISVPSMVAAAIDPDMGAIRRKTGPQINSWVSIKSSGDDFAISECELPKGLRRRGLMGKLAGQGRPYDRGSTVLAIGAIGLATITALDTFIALGHEPLVTALYDAMLTTATIITPNLHGEPPRMLWATIAAFLVMGFTAAFGAGIVHHLLEGGHVGLVGRRVAPKSGHVIIAGMGQVGIRLAQELSALGIAVVCIEQKADVPTMSLAKTLKIPVVIGDASSTTLLKQVGIKKSIAVVAAGSDERDNIAIALNALAANPNVNVVMRSGSDDVIDETRSLFRIGATIDVNALTAAYVAHAVKDDRPYLTLHAKDSIVAIDEEGKVTEKFTSVTTWCNC
jgi:Trk K+ transport system NAD-binding subunit